MRWVMLKHRTFCPSSGCFIVGSSLVALLVVVLVGVYTHMFGCRNCRLLEHSRWSYGFKLYQPFYSLYSILLMSFFTSYPYIVTIISLLLLELAVVVAIFFRMDWKMLFAKLIDKYHTKFKIFWLFHLKMCRFVTILILVPQINVLALVVISLWAIGTEQRRHRNDSEQASIIQSFLVRPNSPVPDTSRHACCSCENLPEST
ncbi:hypothetical protein CISIN_1g046491mg [Citrus sinensis]|uniref:Uncharacterized protein n=1 Tax=Citrus sinensis TaxID=2711 RepID=A0A067GWR8_CITSI|nr:hypothetical protein CISIN_1g046491mg [Citrus sinensis]